MVLIILFWQCICSCKKAGCPWEKLEFSASYLSLTTCIENDYNRASTSPQWPRPLYNRHFFVLEDSPYIDSCLNLSKIATSVQQQWPIQHVPTPKVTSRQRPAFTVTDEKVKNDPYGALMINRSNRFMIVFYFYCFSKHKCLW